MNYGRINGMEKMVELSLNNVKKYKDTNLVLENITF